MSFHAVRVPLTNFFNRLTRLKITRFEFLCHEHELCSDSPPILAATTQQWRPTLGCHIHPLANLVGQHQTFHHCDNNFSLADQFWSAVATGKHIIPPQEHAPRGHSTSSASSSSSSSQPYPPHWCHLCYRRGSGSKGLCVLNWFAGARQWWWGWPWLCAPHDS